MFGIGISLGCVAGDKELLSMIGVVCSSPPANSVVTWCVSKMLMMSMMGYYLCCPGYRLWRGIGTVGHTTDCTNDVIALFATSVSSWNIRSYDTESLLSNKISIKSRFLVLLWRSSPICRGSLVSLSMLRLLSVWIDSILLHLAALNVKRSDIDRAAFLTIRVIFRLGLDVCATKDHLN